MIPIGNGILCIGKKVLSTELQIPRNVSDLVSYLSTRFLKSKLQKNLFQFAVYFLSLQNFLPLLLFGKAYLILARL